MSCLKTLRILISLALFYAHTFVHAEAANFPARDLLQAIKQLEAKDLQDSPIHVYFDYRKAHPEAPALEWDPFAAPFSARSWLMFNLEDDMMDRLKKNIDEKGQRLL